MPRFWDITLPYDTNLPVWPGDADPVIRRRRSMERGDSNNVTDIEVCVHYGTHMDAPKHFIADGGGIETVGLDVLVGSAQVVEVPDVQAVLPEHLIAAGIADDIERLLVKTRNSALWNNRDQGFVTDFAALHVDTAKWLVARGIKLVAIDYLSIELFDDPAPTTHQTLLGAGVAVVEGIDLREVDPGHYKLTCLPINIVDSDGAPVRAILESL